MTKRYDLIPYIYYYENRVYVLYDPDVNDGGYAKRKAEQSEIPFVDSIDKRCLKYKDTKTVIGDYDGLAYARMVSKLADKLYKPISRVFTAQDAEGQVIIISIWKSKLWEIVCFQRKVPINTDFALHVLKSLTVGI